MRIFLALIFAGLLSACTGSTDLPPADQTARKAYVSGAPASVTLVTMKSVKTGRGEHSALLIDGSERVLYDPAGSFSLPKYAHENRDVHYGITDEIMEIYNFYHARKTHFVEMLELPVSRAMADQLIARAVEVGPQPKMFCARAVGQVLKPVGPFGDVPITFYPEPVHAAFAEIPGVKRTEVREGDVGQNINFIPKGDKKPAG